MFVEYLSYTIARAGIDRLSTQSIKGWPISSYIVALMHQILVLPYAWFVMGDAEACFRLTTAYFASDLLLNISVIDRRYALHHIASLVLLIGGPRLLAPEMVRVSCHWLVLLEIGSAGISLTDLTGRFYTLDLHSTLSHEQSSSRTLSTRRGQNRPLVRVAYCLRLSSCTTWVS